MKTGELCPNLHLKAIVIFLLAFSISHLSHAGYKEVGDSPPTGNFAQEAFKKIANAHGKVIDGVLESSENIKLRTHKAKSAAGRAAKKGAKAAGKGLKALGKALFGGKGNGAGGEEGEGGEQGCGNSSGSDVTVHLPPQGQRDGVGELVFPGSEGIDCTAKGKGTGGGVFSRKGDTPPGKYKAAGEGGNSKKTWGQKGVQLKQVAVQGRKASTLFIHSKTGLTSGRQLFNRASWGCILVPQQCMTAFKQYVKGNPDASIGVIETGCKAPEAQ